MPGRDTAGLELPARLALRSYATPAVAMTYANAYSRASVQDNLCGYSFAATDPRDAGARRRVAGNANALAQLFGTGNGVPAHGPLQHHQQNSVGGPRRDQVSISPSTGAQDFNVDGAVCLRSLSPGPTAPERPDRRSAGAFQRAQGGIKEVLRTGRPARRPRHPGAGPGDALVPVNHASRAYLGANKLAEGASLADGLLRGHERAAFRRLHLRLRPRVPGALPAAAPLRDPGPRSDVRAS